MEFNRCYGCMRELPAPGAVCPHCEYDNTNDPGRQPSHVLPCGSVLNGQYMVGRSLGQGGFGITYIGYDLNLEIPVCIKEYYPEGSASRSATQSRMVYWGTSENARGMKENRRSFVKEAQKAVKLRNLSHMVTVWGVFYENETAYIVMDYIEGETLKSRMVRTQKTLGERECVELLTPVMEDLEKAHARGIIHRDIKPDNIMLAADGEPILLDMGAAKDLGKSAQGSGTLSSTMVVSQGFSPREQYRAKGNIGPWTDVYAMCATIYYCVTGRVPPTPMDRDDGEEINLHKFSPTVAQVLEKGMALRVENRIQSMSELIAALRAALDGKMSTPKTEPKKPVPETNSRGKNSKLPLILGLAAAAAVLLVFWFMLKKPDIPVVLPEASTTPTATVVASTTTPSTPTPAPWTPTATTTAYTVGDIFSFGKYEQDNNTNNGKEDIEWLVLDKEGDRLLVISRYALDCVQYNTEFKSVTWETCSLRKWLNDTFFNAAFSTDEQDMIPTVTVSADMNPSFSTSPGNSTKDQVFLLSIQEVKRYFGFEKARMCVPTAYAIAQGAYTSNEYSVGGKATCSWWLRSPGYNSIHAADVDIGGSVDAGGYGVSLGSVAVRPTLWINLETQVPSIAPKQAASYSLSPVLESPSPVPESPSLALKSPSSVLESPSPVPESPSPVPSTSTPNKPLSDITFPIPSITTPTPTPHIPLPDITFPIPSVTTPMPSEEPLSTGKTETDLYYEVYANGVRISGCDSGITEAVIPAVIDGKPVTTIADGAFAQCYSLTSVTIPSSVKTIGLKAFAECYRLTDIYFPDSMKPSGLGESAFRMNLIIDNSLNSTAKIHYGYEVSPTPTTTLSGLDDFFDRINAGLSSP